MIFCFCVWFFCFIFCYILVIVLVYYGRLYVDVCYRVLILCSCRSWLSNCFQDDVGVRGLQGGSWKGRRIDVEGSWQELEFVGIVGVYESSLKRTFIFVVLDLGVCQFCRSQSLFFISELNTYFRFRSQGNCRELGECV